MDKLVLIDGESLLEYTFQNLPERAVKQGNINGVYGFWRAVLGAVKKEQANICAVVFDGKEDNPSLKEGKRLAEEGCRILGIPIFCSPGHGRFDTLAFAAGSWKKLGGETALLSADRSVLSLAEETIHILTPYLGAQGEELRLWGPEELWQEYGLKPGEFPDYLALSGKDGRIMPWSSSIGKKRALKLLQEHRSLKNLWDHRGSLRPESVKKAVETYYSAMEEELKRYRVPESKDMDLPIGEAARLGDGFEEKAASYLGRLLSVTLKPETEDNGFGLIHDREGQGFLQEGFSQEGSKEGFSQEGFLQEGFSFDDLGAEIFGFGEASEQPEDKAEQIRSRITLVTGKEEVKRIFREASLAETAGFQLLLGTLERQREWEEGGQLSFDFTCQPIPSAAGLALCLGEDQIFCIQTGSEISEKFLLEHLREFCSGQGKKWVLDLKSMLPYLDLDDTAAVCDAGVAGYLLNPLKAAYDYEELASDYLGLSLPSRKELLGKEELGEAFAQGDERGILCGGYMAYVVWRSASVLEEKLKETGMDALYRTIEMPLIYSLYHMEQEGIQVERQSLKEYGSRLKVDIVRLEQEIWQDTGMEFNINSPKQLGEILFEKMGLPGGKKTKTGYSTAADVLEKLAPDYPVVQKILDYRQLTKLNSTYAEGLAAYIGEDGRIHGKFNQTITATGRISSTEPNLQNIPVRMALGREIRKVFVPKEGYVFVDADYSQIELRILAHMSGDERLVEAYRSAQDIHAITASQVFHVPLDQVTALQRSNAKAVNFGIVYGISAFGLSEGLSISRKEAMEYIENYFETYPGVKAFLDGLVAEGKEKGYVTTLYGRRRPIPELSSSNFMRRQFGERVAMNSPIQGTAADIMKIAMIAVDRELRRQGLKSRIVLQIHDELLIETAKDEIQAVKEILTDKMKHAADLKVALEVQAEVGESWFDAK